MAGLQLSGLASGLDWKSLVDQLMQLEAAPVTRMQTEQTNNTLRSNALKDLSAKLSSLQTAASSLKDTNLFSSRTAVSATTGSSWQFSPSPGAVTGTFQIAVGQLATQARREGALDITQGIASTGDVSGVTLATMRTASTITGGTFSINGAKVTVAATDSLKNVFDAIATATGGDVSASYDPLTDKVTMASASHAEIVLGASNDSSNFLQILKLANNGTESVSSYGNLGSASTGNFLASAGLKTAVTAVDVDGSGSFVINGETINYNVNSDSLSALLKRINASAAGVRATYDAVNDRVQLANASTGDLGITLSETAGGVLGALGLTTGFNTVRGKNAEFSVDGGATIISTSNTLDGSAHGITGLSVTVDSVTTQSVTVAANTTSMRGQIDAFISAYNALNTYIDDKTKVTTTNGKVTASILTDNREVQAWSRDLRRLAFQSIDGLTGAVKRINDLGIDLDQNGQMSIKDSTKLDTALANHSGDVEAFFSNTTTGFGAQFDTLLGHLVDTDTASQTRLSAANSSLDRQIADFQRLLDQKRQQLTNGFIAMESAQSKIQSQSAALTNAFGSNTTSK